MKAPKFGSLKGPVRYSLLRIKKLQKSDDADYVLRSFLWAFAVSAIWLLKGRPVRARLGESIMHRFIVEVELFLRYIPPCIGGKRISYAA